MCRKSAAGKQRVNREHLGGSSFLVFLRLGHTVGDSIGVVQAQEVCYLFEWGPLDLLV
jgi:hypothetical protein